MNCKFIHDPCVFCYFVLGLQNGLYVQLTKNIRQKALGRAEQ